MIRLAFNILKTGRSSCINSDLRPLIQSLIKEMISSGKTTFYKYIDNELCYYDIETKDYKTLPSSKKEITFLSQKNKNKIIKKNWSASVVDLDDGIVGVEFHSVLKEELNPIDGSIIETLEMANQYVDKNNCKGIVISGDGINFSAGANLNLILNAADRGDWESIEELTGVMQQILQGLRFSNFPELSIFRFNFPKIQKSFPKNHWLQPLREAP